MLNIVTIPAFDDNYIWLVHRQGNQNCVVVDPGDAQPVLEALKQHQLNLEAILITHHHPDHVGGVKQLVAETGATVYGPRNETIDDVEFQLDESSSVKIEKSQLDFRVIDVPGHTNGHIAYYTDTALFSGDSLFAGGCGRLFEGTPEDMYLSLSKLAELPDDTRVYCAHEYTEANLKFALAVEPSNQELIERIEKVAKTRAEGKSTVPSLMATEKATNPFLRCQHESLTTAASTRLGRQPGSQIETFASIRQWKDSF